jgi:hypothetical protein
MIKYNKMTSSFGTNMQELRSKEETLNVGTKWTIEEDNKLVHEIADNKNYEEIALEHKRTIFGVKIRVISHIIYPKIKDCLVIDIESLSVKYRIDAMLLTRQINKIKSKEVIKQISVNQDKATQTQINNDVPTNKQILEYLQKLDNKMDEVNAKLDNLAWYK